MIPITDLSWQSLSWQDQLSHSVRSSKELSAALNLDLAEVETSFPVNVPRAYLDRIVPGNPRDPLLLQVLTQANELDENGESSPLKEESFDQGFGMIQKYRGRLLVVTTGSCAINCRYCFRKNFPYEDHQPSSSDWHQIFEHIKQDSSITEVILSGGDPLMLNDKRLAWIFDELNQINHLQTIRLHTRLPIVIPDRVTANLVATFEASRSQIVMVTHVNHGNEIDLSVVSALQKLRQIPITLLNQSVLLQGVNDSIEALTHLSQQLNSSGIIPYYLHLMDKVKGAGHFDVSEATGRELIQQLRVQLPGYLVPRLAREVPFEGSKTLIA